MPRYYTQRTPFSGDKLVDIIFKTLLEVLEKEIEVIRMKKVLRDPDNKHRELHGLLVEGKIYLGKRRHRIKNTPLVKTLIHELIHAAIPSLGERRVRQLEEVLYARFTDGQKRFLRKFIPKHEVKRDPNTS